ncbi:MAG TPA: LacI family DNA-binding transcriptional regulator [Paenibacillus sp.]|nr:LacI family DNA-binding transcriptional regulator [Paenibacillus sp.]
MNPTINDVAKLANTSKSTVSRFLNGKRVRKDTEAALKQAIEELNFHINVNARRLVLNRTQTIAVVLDDITNSFYSKIIRGIEQVVSKHGYNCMYLSCTTHYRDELTFLNMFREGQVDGIIFVSFQKRSPETLRQLRDCGYPVSLVGDCAGEKGIFAVDVDNSAGIKELVSYLHRIGHERIAYISGPSTSSATHARYEGYRDRLRELGLDFRTEWVVESEWSNEGGYRAMEKLLSVGGFTAVVGSNDAQAMGALRAAQERGYQVPRDFSVAGFDDIPAAGWVYPPLTTIRQPFIQIGIKAAAGLFEMLEANETDHCSHLLQPELIIRQSCSAI